MRFPYARRIVPAAAAITLITLVASCGTEAGTKTGTEAGAGTGPSSAVSSPAPAVRAPFTEEELTARSLTPQDLPGHRVEEAFQGALVSADKPECREIATVLLGGAMTGTLGQVHTRATKDATTTKVSLHSWAGTKTASGVLAGVRSGGQACGGGFNAVSGTDRVKFSNVVATSAAGGDESLAYRAEQERGGEKSSVEVVLVRQGTVTATFTANSTSGAAEPPSAVVAAQLGKLR
ncbi:hypothetical protein ACGFXC_34150 [Streptomyces sp. NPDC048507]|uniref:hypothetical protein n=1 Tax=Streptomyces sp. NPDC048507 TaxID=3365560 RepID=UPI003715175F